MLPCSNEFHRLPVAQPSSHHISICCLLFQKTFPVLGVSNGSKGPVAIPKQHGGSNPNRGKQITSTHLGINSVSAASGDRWLIHWWREDPADYPARRGTPDTHSYTRKQLNTGQLGGARRSSPLAVTEGTADVLRSYLILWSSLAPSIWVVLTTLFSVHITFRNTLGCFTY